MAISEQTLQHPAVDLAPTLITLSWTNKHPCCRHATNQTSGISTSLEGWQIRSLSEERKGSQLQSRTLLTLPMGMERSL